ncbi:MAG: insulinase family protein [Deltaproteobacteria bacterium]|nr:insulinase family protein [Deltaproteobacteria bacterium]
MTERDATDLPLLYCEQYNSYLKTTLNNGIRIVTEQVPFLQSVSLGIWVRSGSRFESPGLNGICHFIEHMLFKGTKRRTTLDIAREIDSVGGVINAFTSKELTSFYCKVLKEDLGLAADLLTDIYLNASFPEEEIEREKQVICQEIYQLEDSPEELVHEIFGMRFWPDDPLGQPILGTIPTVSNMDRETIERFKLDNYTPEETVICAAGNLDHERFLDLVAKQMASLPRGSGELVAPPARVGSSSHIVTKDLEQVHICIGVEGPRAADESRHAAYIVNAILGGGMSSRLFQEVREKRGLAYTVYSFLSSFSDTGMFGIYAACDPARLEELLQVIGKETLGLTSSITAQDVRTAKNQIKGNLIMAMESSEARMNRLAKGEYFFGRHMPLEEIVESLEAVTPARASETAAQMLNARKFTIVALGPIDENGDLTGLMGL